MMVNNLNINMTRPAVTGTEMWQVNTERAVTRQWRKTSAWQHRNSQIKIFKQIQTCPAFLSSEISNRMNDQHQKYIIWIFQTWLRADSSQAGHECGAVHFTWWHWKFTFWVRWLDRQWYNKCPPVSEEYQWPAGNVCVGEDHYAQGMQQ